MAWFPRACKDSGAFSCLHLGLDQVTSVQEDMSLGTLGPGWAALSCWGSKQRSVLPPAQKPQGLAELPCGPRVG